MTVVIRPGFLKGEIQAPPSKSVSHRLLLAASLAEGESEIRGVEKSRDLESTISCLDALGAEAENQNGIWKIRGAGSMKRGHAVFPCGESASTLRFFLPTALLNGEEAEFQMSGRLMERGVGAYESLLGEKGIAFKKERDRLFVKGKLQPGEYAVDGSLSSQFTSGLLFALPRLTGDSILRLLPPVESRPYIGMTLGVLKRAGIVVNELHENEYIIPGNQKYRPLHETVEGDWSNAAVYLAMNAVGHQITATGLAEESLQGDKRIVGFLRELEKEAPVIDLSDTPDLAPILFAAAAAKNGAVFEGVRRLRFKESDRLSSMAEELSKCGVDSVVEENRMTVKKSRLHAPDKPFSSHNDHRVAMAVSMLMTLVGGELEGAEAVGKSWPTYFETLRALGCRMEVAEK